MDKFDKKKEHAERRKWNLDTAKKLGLDLILDGSQIRIITVKQGKYTLYHDWSAITTPETNYQMHKDLERFFKSYWSHFKTFEPVANHLKLVPDM